jgi:hypothetical protein
VVFGGEPGAPFGFELSHVAAWKGAFK